MAVVCCREETSSCDSEELKQTIGRCCLIASDCLSQATQPIPPENASIEEQEEWFVTLGLPLMEFNPDTRRAELLLRAREFWLDLPATPEIQRRARSAGFAGGLDGLFRDRYGVSLREFVLVILATFSHFLQQQGEDPRLLDIDTYFGQVKSTELARRVFSITAQKPSELATILLDHPRQSWYWDLTPIRRYPLLEVLPGQFACPDVSLLYRTMADGVYWLLVEASGAKANDFKTLFGHLFERYADSRIGQFGYKDSVLARTFYPSPNFAGTNDEVCDGLLHWTQTAAFLEYKSRLLTTRQKYAGITEELFKGVDQVLIGEDRGSKSGEKGRKGLDQLASGIARVYQGEAITGMESPATLSNCKFFSVLVTYEEAMGFHAVQRRAQRRMTQLLARHGVPAGKVGPVVLLTIGDLEVIQDLQAKISVEQLLLEYSNRVLESQANPVGSFHSYVYEHFRSIDRSSTKGQATQLFRDARAELEERQRS
jgi:hypothetical protein